MGQQRTDVKVSARKESKSKNHEEEVKFKRYQKSQEGGEGNNQWRS